MHKPLGMPAAALQAQPQGWAPPNAPVPAQMRLAPHPLSCPAAGGCSQAPQALRGCGQRGCSPEGCSPACLHTWGCLQHQHLGDVGRAGPSTHAGAKQDTSEDAVITHLKLPNPTSAPDQAMADVEGVANRPHIAHD